MKSNSKQVNYLIANYFIPVVLILGLLIFYFFTYARQYVLSGDDLFLILKAPTSVSAVEHLFSDFSGQYRPLTHSFFIVYAKLLRVSDSYVKIVHYALISSIAIIWWALLKRFVSPLESALLTLSTFLNPIFFYHMYAIASLNNLLVLLTGLLLGHCYFFIDKKRKSMVITLVIPIVLFTLALFSKETFVPLYWILLLIWWKAYSRKQFLIFIALSFLPLAAYLYLRLFGYSVTSGDYSFQFTLNILISNIKLLGLWVLGYPTGWQYAAADSKNILTYFVSLVYTGIFGIVFIMQLQKKNILFLFNMFILIALSLVPYLFLQRVLVFYLDITYLLVVFVVAVSMKILGRKARFALLGALVVAATCSFYLYHPQWHEYSFVAHANTTAKNLLQVSLQQDLSSINQVCILNHQAGYWATADGQILSLYKVYDGNILSVRNSQDSAVCDKDELKKDNTLVLINDGWNYAMSN